MAIIKVDYGEISGGGKEIFIVSVGHVANSTTVNYDFDEVDILGTPKIRTDMTKTFSATSYGGVFDTTIQLSSTLSVRLYSSVYTNTYFLVDVIKSGVTVKSAQQVTTLSTNNLGSLYTTSFVVGA